MLGFSQFGKQPVDFGGLKGHVDLDSGVAGDGGGDAGGTGVGVFGLLLAVGGEDLFEHALEFPALQADGRGLDGEGTGAEGFGFKAVAFEFGGERGEDDHLFGEEFDEDGHEQALTLNALGFALT